MDKRIAILLLLALMSVQGCASHRLRNQTLTLSRMDALNGVVKQFVRTRGVPPTGLEEVCALLTSCTEQRRTWVDGWGTRFLYQTDSLGFVIRSAWQDSKMFTLDDLLLSSTQQSDAAHALSGCYQLSGSIRTDLSMVIKLTDILGENGSFRVEANGVAQGWWSPIGSFVYIQLANGSHLLHAVLTGLGDRWSGYMEGSQFGYTMINASRATCS
jgi:hypothetical protein